MTYFDFAVGSVCRLIGEVEPYDSTFIILRRKETEMATIATYGNIGGGGGGWVVGGD